LRRYAEAHAENQRGIHAYEQRDWDEAIAHFRAASLKNYAAETMRGNVGLALDAKGVELASRGQLKEAINYFLEALQWKAADPIIIQNVRESEELLRAQATLTAPTNPTVPASSDKPVEDASTRLFGIGSPPRELVFKDLPDVSPAALADPLDQLRVASCLSRSAADALNYDEASFLAGQANKAMSGALLDVDITGCAAGPAPVVPYSPEAIQFSLRILKATNDETLVLKERQERSVTLRANADAAKRDVEQKKKAVAALRADLQTPYQSPRLPLTPPPPQQTGPSPAVNPLPSPEPLDDSLARAMAAQVQVEQAAAESERLAEDAAREESDSLKRVAHLRGCFDSLKNDASRIEELKRTCQP
jgi:tetratricopeptide (TPR) repeat protein